MQNQGKNLIILKDMFEKQMTLLQPTNMTTETTEKIIRV